MAITRRYLHTLCVATAWDFPLNVAGKGYPGAYLQFLLIVLFRTVDSHSNSHSSSYLFNSNNLKATQSPIWFALSSVWTMQCRKGFAFSRFPFGLRPLRFLRIDSFDYPMSTASIKTRSCSAPGDSAAKKDFLAQELVHCEFIYLAFCFFLSLLLLLLLLLFASVEPSHKFNFCRFLCDISLKI